MSTLIFKLPSGLPAANTALVVVQQPTGLGAPRHHEAPLALLPDEAGAERVALVPPQRLSWQLVQLPAGTLDKGFFQDAGSARLRTVLDGLLEERVLDDTAQLHFAIAPNVKTGSATWVAVCDRVWLQAWLGALEQAGRAVTRIVPEFSPAEGPEAPALKMVAIGTADNPQLVCTGAAGVVTLALSATTLQWLQHNENASSEPAQWWAEPGVAQMAEQLVGRPLQLQTETERAVLSAQSPWDLAQFEFSASRQARSRRQWASLLDTLLRGPQWRAARWAMLALMVAQLAGLQAWSWKEQSAQAAKRSAIAAVLTSTFPDTKVVVDAPIQMAKSVAALQRQSGAATGTDLEALLNQFGTLAPLNASPTAVDFVGSELRIAGLDSNSAEYSSMAANLQALGYAARWDGPTLSIAPAPTGAKP